MIRKVIVNHIDQSSATIELSPDGTREKVKSFGAKSREAMRLARQFLDTGIEPEGEFTLQKQDDSCGEMYSADGNCRFFDWQDMEAPTSRNGWRKSK